MEINIFGLSDLESFLPTHSKEYSVVQYTPSARDVSPFVVKEAKEYIHLPVDDLDNYNYSNYNPPHIEDIEKILDFTKDKKKLIIACTMGISRSSATAYLVNARHKGSASEGLKILRGGHHHPNRLIVNIGSRLLNNDDIWSKYVEWMRSYYGIDSSRGGTWPDSKVISKMKIK